MTKLARQFPFNDQRTPRFLYANFRKFRAGQIPEMNPPRGKRRGITERGSAPMTAGGIHPRSKLRGIEPSRLIVHGLIPLLLQSLKALLRLGLRVCLPACSSFELQVRPPGPVRGGIDQRHGIKEARAFGFFQGDFQPASPVIARLMMPFSPRGREGLAIQLAPLQF